MVWSETELGEALPLMARRLGLSAESEIISGGSFGTEVEGYPLDLQVKRIAVRVGFEAQEVSVGYRELDTLIRSGGPMVVRLAGEGACLCLMGARGRRARLMARDGALVSVHVGTIRLALAAATEARYADEVDGILGGLDIPESRRAAAREALLRELVGSDPVAVGWLLRLSARGSFLKQLRKEGAVRWLSLSLVTHGAYYALWVLSWWLIGEAALTGRIEVGWLVAWALLLATLVPLRSLVLWSQGRFSLSAGTILKQRLLAGALDLVPDHVRREGVGQLLGRVIESEAVESMALTGGLVVLTSLLEISMASFVLASGAAPLLHLTTLLLVCVVIGLLFLGYHRQRSRWTDSRLAVTHDLVENAVGHRTLVAQQSPDRWHGEGDRAIEVYLERSRVLDRYRAWVSGVPRAWLVLGLAALLPALVRQDVHRIELAVSLGGLLLIYRALASMVGGFSQLVAARISWQRVALLFNAARREDSHGGDACTFGDRGQSQGEPILVARDLTYRHRGRVRSVVARCSLDVAYGDRVLLEGPSGSGKSTLAAILAGLREPDSGVLIVSGVDHRSVASEEWRRIVAMVPQFHENHVVSETFAFNLLMGRSWPPVGNDMKDAEEVCRELGLGGLIDRMPGGLLQRIGEAGWKLSHGERSRLFLARALLQDADLLIIDEAFGTLDPPNLRKALRCVEERAKSLVVIAHP